MEVQPLWCGAMVQVVRRGSKEAHRVGAVKYVLSLCACRALCVGCALAGKVAGCGAWWIATYIGLRMRC